MVEPECGKEVIGKDKAGEGITYSITRKET